MKKKKNEKALPNNRLLRPHTKEASICITKKVNQPITDIGSAEDDFVDGFLFDDLPSQRHPLTVEFPYHGPVAWITKFGINIVADEIEKGRELGITDSLGVGFVSLGEAVQKGEDVFRGDLLDGSIIEFFDIPLDDGPVGSHRIFFWDALVVIDQDFGCFGKFHGRLLGFKD